MGKSGAQNNSQSLDKTLTNFKPYFQAYNFLLGLLRQLPYTSCSLQQLHCTLGLLVFTCNNLYCFKNPLFLFHLLANSILNPKFTRFYWFYWILPHSTKNVSTVVSTSPTLLALLTVIHIKREHNYYWNSKIVNV